ncbi:MAG: family 16 glycosylhydrolase [Rubricoccaceae bacterium]|nr:family 16 glycosylhydrolase [Rubricoccaceae bacterium]
MRLLPLALLLPVALIGCDGQGPTASGADGAEEAAPADWVLVWEEDFSVRDAAFEERWDVGTHTFNGNESHFNPANVVVEDGLLKLRLTDVPYGQREYSGAELRTDNEEGFFTYGRFEVRMKAAGGRGIVSSFFTYRYAPWQEIDIEFRGKDTDQMQANVFFNPGPLGAPNNDPFNPFPFPKDAPIHCTCGAAEAFHVYAFEWEPGVVRWFIDGEPVLETRDPATVPDLPQQLMMNIWTSAYPNWLGELDEEALPAEAHYDWVRVYRRSTSPSP